MMPPSWAVPLSGWLSPSPAGPPSPAAVPSPSGPSMTAFTSSDVSLVASGEALVEDPPLHPIRNAIATIIHGCVVGHSPRDDVPWRFTFGREMSIYWAPHKSEPGPTEAHVVPAGHASPGTHAQLGAVPQEAGSVTHDTGRGELSTQPGLLERFGQLLM